MKKRILFLSLIVLCACRKVPKDNSRYMETLTYNDDGSSVQREWNLDTYNKGASISAIHLEDDAELVGGKRSYWMNIAMEKDKDNKNMSAYIYDDEKGVLNNKHTLKRLYNYDGEKYTEHNQINFKGTFEETIVYYDTAHVVPNDTTFRKGTFVLEYEGKTKE